jgi:putative glycosyltransferase
MPEIEDSDNTGRAASSPPKLSIVTTMYKSASFLREFLERASLAARRLTNDYEVVFVNDGSPDESLDTALDLFRVDEHVVVVDLARNFGHHKAMMTGLAHANGEVIFLVDCDLEEQPELLLDFWDDMTSKQVDVVYGVQEGRKGGLLERASGALFYKSFNAMSPVSVLPNVVTARLMTRRYVTSLLAYREREVSLLGLWALAGYEQAPRMIHKSKREGTSYSMRKRVAVAVNSVTSFTNAPLVLVFWIGLLISVLSLMAAVGLVAYRIMRPFAAGWPSVIVSIWLLGGLTILCLGVIGIYLSKVFSETKQRPYTIVREVHSHAGDIPTDAVLPLEASHK